ncbi:MULTISPECIES: TNT domain-containing protein [unclassified Gilliamella]
MVDVFGLRECSVKNVKKAGTEIAPYWPSNNGALGKWKSKFLMPGDLIDRFGSEYGKYLSPIGVPMNMRALPPSSNKSAYNVYRVIKPFEVKESIIAPAFNQIGLGTQYLSPVSVKTLLKKGIIEIVKI